MSTYRISKIKYRKSRPMSSSGFSLIELLVSMALLAIIAGIGISIFAIINNSYTRANAISKMQTQGQQTMEQLERTIRSASGVELQTSGVNGCAANQCLVLSIPTASIEYDLNGGCAKTAYSWTAPSYVAGSQVNGRIKRYSLTAAYAPCNGGAVDMFDTDTSQGVSVEQQGSTAVFTKNTAGTIDNVSISYNLIQGVLLKPASGPDNRANVPLKTTASLRNY